MEDGILVQHTSFEKQHNEIMPHNDDIQLSSEMVSCEKIDLHSSNFIELSGYEKETLIGVLPSLTVAGLTNDTINEIGKMHLYTLTRNGISICPNELMAKKDGALFGVIADVRGKFAAMADVSSFDIKSVPKINLLAGANIATAVYAVLAAITQKKFLDKINKNLSQLNAEVGDIKLILTEAQRAKVIAAMNQLDDINKKKEVAINSPEIKTIMLSEIAHIKGVAEESRAFYGKMINLDAGKYLLKTKNKKDERIKKERIKTELLQDLVFYEIGHELHAAAELFTLYFDGQYNADYLQMLREDFSRREIELAEIKELTANAIAEVDLRKAKNQIMLAMTSIEPKLDQLPKPVKVAIDILAPGASLPLPGGHRIESKVADQFGFNIVEESKAKHEEIKQKVHNRASHEVEAKGIGDLSAFIESIDKMDAFYNRPIQLINDHDNYYLKVGETA